MKKLFYFLIFSLSHLSASAQSDDFGLDFSLEAQKKLSKQWSLSLEGEYRSRNNAKTNDRWSIGLGVDYKVAKWLKASAGYTLLYDNNERISYFERTDDAVLEGDAEVGDPKKCAQYWGTRHRFNVSLTASQKWGDFKFSLRERWQYTYRPEYTVDERWSLMLTWNSSMPGACRRRVSPLVSIGISPSNTPLVLSIVTKVFVTMMTTTSPTAISWA